MNRKNTPLYIALALPALMVILVAAFIYLPGIGKKPAHNFVYVSGENYYGYPNIRYTVSNSRLEKKETLQNNAPVPYPPVNTPSIEPHLYLYDVHKDQSIEINLQQAQGYALDPSLVSDDGYTVVRGSGGGDFPFGGPSDYSSWYMKGYNRSKKLNVKLASQDYYNLQFLGWIR